MTKSNNKLNNTKSSYILIPIKSYKEKKSNPCDQINKYVNKYNTKNDRYYHSPYENDNSKYSYYLKNSGIYIEHWKGIL